MSKDRGLSQHKFLEIWREISTRRQVISDSGQYGWHGKSMGCKTITPDGDVQWTKVSKHRDKQQADALIEKLYFINSISGIKKPRIHKACTIQRDGIFFSVAHMEYISEPTFSKNDYLPLHGLGPEGPILHSLQQQLENLSAQPTPFIAYRQDLITRRIHERFPRIRHTTLTRWCTVHGDVHWNNVSQAATFLDWESYGKGPEGIDIAFLYAFSLKNKIISQKLEAIFRKQFASYEFNLCLLFVCRELCRMIYLYQDHPALWEDLNRLGAAVYKDLLS